MSTPLVTFHTADEPLQPGDILMVETPGFGVGLIIRIGTLSHVNHAETVLEVAPGVITSAAAFGDKRGMAIRTRTGVWTGYVIRLVDPTKTQVLMDTVIDLCGESGKAWRIGQKEQALTLPGTPYAWASIGIICLRSLRAMGLRWLISEDFIFGLAAKVAKKGYYICSQAERIGVEKAVGSFTSKLPVAATSPADLLDMFNGYGRERPIV